MQPAKLALLIVLFCSCSSMAQVPEVNPPDTARALVPFDRGHIQAEIDRNRKFETIGHVMTWAGFIKYLTLLNGEITPGAAVVQVSLEAVNEIGLLLLFRSNGRYNELYNMVDKEGIQLSSRGRSEYIFSKVVLVGSIGAVFYGANTENLELAIGGVIGYLLSDVIDFYSSGGS